MWSLCYGILSCVIYFAIKVKNLQEKWRDYFDFVDVNNDSVLDNADVSLSKDNYVRLHNLTAAEVCGYCNCNFVGWLQKSLLASACFCTFGESLFKLLKLHCLPEIRIWSILLIKSDSKWCIHLSRSLFLNFNHLVSVTAGGPVSPRGHM